LGPVNNNNNNKQIIVLIVYLLVVCRYLTPVNYISSQFAMLQMIVTYRLQSEMEWLHLVHLLWLNYRSNLLISTC